MAAPLNPPPLTRQTPLASGWQWLLQVWPGLGLCAVVATAASTVAALHQGPQLLYVLLFGITLNSLAESPRVQAGLTLCAKLLLRLGVALLGVRLTLADVAGLGWATVALVVLAVAATIGGSLLGAHWLSLPRRLGLVSGVASGICGASAALAVSAVLPRVPGREAEHDRQTLVVVVGVTSLSTLAMLLYPMLGRCLGLSATQAGVFLGGSIHDVAQVVGAGMLMGPAVANVAVVVKLMRVSLLALVVLAVAGAVRHRARAGQAAGTATGMEASAPPWLPWFMQVFLLLLLLNTLGLVPAPVQAGMGEASRAGLLLAVAALGLKTDPRALWQAGWRAFALLLAEALWLAGLVLAGVWWLSRG